jgi:hypothetical protein
MKTLESARIMYEIYQENGYNGRYRVVYFTELNDHNKETEINRAMAGRHVHDGFIREWRKDQAKGMIDAFLGRLNGGEEADPEELETALKEVAESFPEGE